MSLKEVILNAIAAHPGAIAGQVKLLVKKHYRAVGEIVPSEEEICDALGLMVHKKQLIFGIDKQNIRHYYINERRLHAA